MVYYIFKTWNTNECPINHNKQCQWKIYNNAVSLRHLENKGVGLLLYVIET